MIRQCIDKDRRIITRHSQLQKKILIYFIRFHYRSIVDTSHTMLRHCIDKDRQIITHSCKRNINSLLICCHCRSTVDNTKHYIVDSASTRMNELSLDTHSFIFFVCRNINEWKHEILFDR